MIVAAAILFFFVIVGAVYRHAAAQLVPPPRRTSIQCDCGAEHAPQHSLRFRVGRFVTLPTSGLLFTLALPSQRTRRFFLLAEAEALLVNQHVRGLIDERDVYERTRDIALQLGFNEHDLPPPTAD